MSVPTVPLSFCEELEYSGENPWRRPDWRSMLATLQRRPRSDEWVRRVRKFRDGDEAERIDKDVFAAHQIHRGPRWHRAEIQARILADQIPAATAAATGVTLPELLAYEQIFFDVRARRSSTFFVRHFVIDAPPLGVYGWNDVEKFWGAAAHQWGVSAVDLLVGSVTHEKLNQHGLDAYLCTDCHVSDGVRFAVLVARMRLGRTESDLRTYQQLVDRILDGDTEALIPPIVLANDRSGSPGESLPSWEECLVIAREMITDFRLAT